MTTNILKKSIFVWNISAICGGDVQKIATTIKTAGFQSAILHSTYLTNWRTSPRIALIKALKALGVEVVASVAVYGANPAQDGLLAANICKDYGLSTFVFDVESTFDAVENSNSAAVKMLNAFCASAPGVQIGWCWWPFYQSSNGKVTFHPKNVLEAAMPLVDFGMPMAYWSWGDAPADAEAYLAETWKQWRAVTDKPLVPAGRAYIGDGGTPYTSSIAAFEAKARALGAVGCTWWSMEDALDIFHLPKVWQALSDLPTFGDVSHVTPPAPTEDPVIKLTAQINNQNVRANPSTTAASLGTLTKGQVVSVQDIKVVGVGDIWIKAASGNLIGWAAMEHGGINYLK